MLKLNKQAQEILDYIEKNGDDWDTQEAAPDHIKDLRSDLTDDDGFYYSVRHGYSARSVASKFLDEESVEKFIDALRIVQQAEDLLDQIAYEV